MHTIEHFLIPNEGQLAPSNLTAVAPCSTAVQLNWTAPTVANATVVSYTILVDDGSNITLISTNSSATTFIVNGLAPSALYSFAVSATTECSGREGPYSDWLTNVSIAAEANSAHVL